MMLTISAFSGCLLSIVHVFFGLQAGNTLQHFKKWKPLLSRWLLWAAVTGLVGGILCNFSKEDGAIPVNKNLWYFFKILFYSTANGSRGWVTKGAFKPKVRTLNDSFLILTHSGEVLLV